jgi:hypothetical protein
MQVHLHISWPGDLSVPADLLWAYCCWICKWSLPLLCILLVGRYMELDVVSYTSLHCLRLLADYLCWIARYMGVTCYLIYQYQLPSLGFFLLTTCSESVVRSSCWFVQGFRLGAETTYFFSGLYNFLDMRCQKELNWEWECRPQIAVTFFWVL